MWIIKHTVDLQKAKLQFLINLPVFILRSIKTTCYLYWARNGQQQPSSPQFQESGSPINRSPPSPNFLATGLVYYMRNWPSISSHQWKFQPWILIVSFSNYNGLLKGLAYILVQHSLKNCAQFHLLRSTLSVRSWGRTICHIFHMLDVHTALQVLWYNYLICILNVAVLVHHQLAHLALL